MGRWLRGADLVVSAAGYQAYHEIVQAGVPAVFVPQRRQYDSQARRALGKLGIAPRAAHGVARSPLELEVCLDRLMGAERAPVQPFEGARQVAEAKRALVSGFGMIVFDRGLSSAAVVLEAA